jgi:hypothetical protein
VECAEAAVIREPFLEYLDFLLKAGVWHGSVRGARKLLFVDGQKQGGSHRSEERSEAQHCEA